MLTFLDSPAELHNESAAALMRQKNVRQSLTLLHAHLFFIVLIKDVHVQILKIEADMSSFSSVVRGERTTVCLSFAVHLLKVLKSILLI